MDWHLHDMKFDGSNAMETSTFTNGAGLYVTLSWENWEEEHGLRFERLMSINVHRPAGDHPVAAGDLRAFSLSELVTMARDAADSTVHVTEEHMTQVEAQMEWPNGDLRKVFGPVATVYNDAVARQQPATKAVADYMEVSRATAGRIISKAREAGYQLASPVPYAGKRKRDHEQGDDE